MAVMKEFWEEVGYAKLNLTSQNLQGDELGEDNVNVMETITSLVGQRDQELQESERIQENIKESEEIMNICVSTPGEVCQNIDSNFEY